MEIIKPLVTELTAENTYQVVVRLENGTILLFPSWLTHSVDANRSDETLNKHQIQRHVSRLCRKNEQATLVSECRDIAQKSPKFMAVYDDGGEYQFGWKVYVVR